MSGAGTFVDSINDSIRMLIILETANRTKPTHRITENRIRLYDYYLRFPSTMFESKAVSEETKVNFDEYYAFFHWKPDVVRYRGGLNYLIARGLVEKKLEDADIVFTVLPKGVEALSKMKSGYKQKLVGFAEQMLSIASKLSDKKIEEEIIERAKIISQKMEGKLYER